jgi:hypothetical protein
VIRSRRDSERLAAKLAASGYTTSARAIVARCEPGVIVVEINHTKVVQL